MSSDVARSFHEYFEMVRAEGPSLKEEVYRLRYQVYCLETGFENPDIFPSGLEKDEYDDQSEHFLVRHKRTGEYAATTRLVLPDPAQPDAPFPMEKHCVIDRLDLTETLQRMKVAEVSRFCVSKSFKRRAGEAGTVTGIADNRPDPFTEDERRSFPHITIGLLSCLIYGCDLHGISHWYAVMEPALIRFFTYIGMYFTGIGPVTEYHGKRQPCMIEQAFLLDSVKRKNVEVWELLTDHEEFSRHGR
jgi:N-acyl amino acid synthase of PEP-CTERM/exosortase system